MFEYHILYNEIKGICSKVRSALDIFVELGATEEVRNSIPGSLYDTVNRKLKIARKACEVTVFDLTTLEQKEELITKHNMLVDEVNDLFITKIYEEYKLPKEVNISEFESQLHKEIKKPQVLSATLDDYFNKILLGYPIYARAWASIQLSNGAELNCILKTLKEKNVPMVKV